MPQIKYARIARPADSRRKCVEGSYPYQRAVHPFGLWVNCRVQFQRTLIVISSKNKVPAAGAKPIKSRMRLLSCGTLSAADS